MWSHTERRTLLRIPCGGGHRSWDWDVKEQILAFIYLKDKKVWRVTYNLDNTVKPVVQVSCFESLI
jgi:hypothetical protein